MDTMAAANQELWLHYTNTCDKSWPIIASFNTRQYSHLPTYSYTAHLGKLGVHPDNLVLKMCQWIFTVVT